MKIFLGGTCNDSKWREKLIPILELHGIGYFNPVVDDWNEEAYKRELYERKNCDYVLYTITPKMTGVYSIAEVVDDSNKKPDSTILCLLRKDENKEFNDSQWKSLIAVSKMVIRNGGKVFYNLEDLINYLINEKSK